MAVDPATGDLIYLFLDRRSRFQTWRFDGNRYQSVHALIRGPR